MTLDPQTRTTISVRELNLLEGIILRLLKIREEGEKSLIDAKDAVALGHVQRLAHKDI